MDLNKFFYELDELLGKGKGEEAIAYIQNAMESFGSRRSDEGVRDMIRKLAVFAETFLDMKMQKTTILKRFL